MMRRIILVLLCGVGLWGCATAGRYLGPTAQGYTFHATAIPNIIFLPSEFLSQENFPSTATLQVQVRDVNEKPVDGVPVTFQFAGSECQGVMTLSAQRAVTSQGRASITLGTDSSTGSCRIAVRVDNVTQDLYVSVSNSPSAPGFR